MPLSAQFEQALIYATRLHAEQTRKASDVPYVAHLMAVAAIALEHGASEEEAIAALLHDAVEDQGGAATREQIRQQFGERVVAIVDGCTDADTIPKPPWRQRKLDYIERLQTASPSVRLISAADKLHNVRSLLSDYERHGEQLWQRFSGGRQGTLWYYRAVTDVLLTFGDTSLVAELDRAVGQLESLAARNA
jgi:GTP pyrophosphokinase